MPGQIDTLTQKISELEADLENAFDEKRREFAYHFVKRKVVFEIEFARRHHEFKINLWSYVRRARLMVVLAAPLIYALVVPFMFLDLMVLLDQAVCFPVNGIKKARRCNYIENCSKEFDAFIRPRWVSYGHSLLT